MVTICVEGDSKDEINAFKKSLEYNDEVIQFQPIEAVGARFAAQGEVLPLAVRSNVEHFIYVLRLFNEKVDKLLGLSFVQQLREYGNEAKMSAEITDNDQYLLDAMYMGPSSEATDAFVLTIRFFIQDNEECSLRNVAEHYNGATVGEEHTRQYLANRTEFNAFLDEFMGLVHTERVVDRDGNVISSIEKRLTRRQVFDICVYGGLSHAKRAKKQAFDYFFGHPFPRALLWHSFVDTLGNYCMYLNAQRIVNTAMLVELEKLV